MMPTMGRKRQSNHGLPPKMHLKSGTYYYVTSAPERKWIKLDKDLAKSKLLWAQLESGKPLGGSFFPVMLQQWLSSEQYASLADATKRTYQTLIDLLPKVFDGPMEAIKPMHVARFMDAHESKAQANIGRVILSNVFDFAIRRGVIDCPNAAKMVPKFTIKGRDRYLTDDEFNRIRESGNDVVKVAMDIAYFTGARITDVLKIRLADCQEDGLFIEQHKTKKRQLFIWTNELRDAISRSKRLPRPIRGLHLLCTNRGKPYTYSAFYAIWSAACSRADVSDVHFHDIRGKAATEAKQQGQDYQAILGHASKSMSDRYIKRREIERVEPVKSRNKI
jgi:integrase